MNTQTKLILAGALGLGVFLIWSAKKVGSVVTDLATTTLNPFSNENIIYDGIIGGTGRALTGDKDFSLGGSIYDLTHPREKFNDPQKPFCTNFLGIGCPDNSP